VTSRSVDDEPIQVDRVRTGVDVYRPVHDAEHGEDNRKHNARVSVDGVGASHVQVLTGRRRCSRRSRRRSCLRLDDALLGVGLRGHLLLLLLLVVMILMRFARRRGVVRTEVRAGC